MKKIIVILLLMLSSLTSFAITEVPLPDMSKSSESIVRTHKELLNNFNIAKANVKGIKLGSMYGEMGMFYQAHEFTNAAKICYQNAVELSPYDFRWQYLLGFIDVTIGDFEDAINMYRSVLTINPDYLVAKVRWAEIELEMGNFDASKKLFKSILDVAPNYAKAFVGLGTINMQQGDFKKALSNYLKALELQPKANQLHYLISQVYSALGEEKKAREHLKRQGQRPVAMYDKTLQEMRLHSVSAVYYSQAAINAYMQNDYKLAEQLVRYSMSLEPRNINPKFTLLNILVSTNRSDEGLVLAKELFKNHPKDDRVTYSLGIIYEIKGDDESAAKWYQKTLELNSKNKTAQLVLANSLLRMKKYNDALVAFRKSQKMDSENPYPIYAEAVILSHLKVCNKSINNFLRAIKKSSDENLTYLTAFVKTVAMCDGVEKQIKNDALVAARNMYLFKPSTRVTQSLAMIEADFGNKKNAIDYQAQVLFEGLMQKQPKKLMDGYKVDLELYKKNKKAKVAIKSYDVDLNPPRAKTVN
jgi:tetratricopeptide (TPR) repeat protein